LETDLAEEACGFAQVARRLGRGDRQRSATIAAVRTVSAVLSIRSASFRRPFEAESFDFA